MRLQSIFIAVLTALCVSTASAQTVTLQVDANPAHAIRTFRTDEALGSTVDKEPAGSIPRLYAPGQIRAMLDAGFGWLSYRLFTELSVQDWHWNPAGRFSAGNEGYWTSSDSIATAAIDDSFGYRLPHRGSTSDQGNNADYSRIDDGDPATFWKSDPYLTHTYTGEPDALHPQWVVVDLGSVRPVNAIRITWAQPYATAYDVQYWTGADAINSPDQGTWRTFAAGAIRNGSGGSPLRTLSTLPIGVRFVRVQMTASSNTCDAHGSSDKRNCVGYAIAELSLGSRNAGGTLHDDIHHAPCGGEKPGMYACGERQTAIYVSSTDPWHKAATRVRDQEQPGLDLIARSGLTRDLPAMYPVAMLYSTPENAAAEVRYLKKRGYAIGYVELGEEPDGQYAEPEDYAALYLQWARALHAEDPALRLGGPAFSGVNSDLKWWPDAHGNTSWLNRFIHYLQRHGAIDQLAFMSFEHYPFEGCEHGAALQEDLLGEPAIIAGMAKTWRADGLPSSVPMFVTEANFSAVNFTQVPMQIEGGLWLADYMAGALTQRIDRVVYYQYEAVPLSQNSACPQDWGNLTMFVAGTNAVVRARNAQFYAGQMLTTEWLAPGHGQQELYAAHSDLRERGNELISVYAVKRPDGTWSILAVNKDLSPHTVRVRFVDGTSKHMRGFQGSVRQVTFGPAQYVWRRAGADSRPSPDDPPLVRTGAAGPGTLFTLPAHSLVVLRGSVQ